jgi:hypothetical protein
MAITIGLLADPGLPSEVARDLVDELPEALKQSVSDRVDWKVCFRCQPFTLDEDDNIPIVEIAKRERSRNGWDLIVCVTDLPRRTGTTPLIADMSTHYGVGLASLPALGGLRLRPRLRDTVLRVVSELRRGDGQGEQQPGIRRTGLLSPVRRVDYPQQDIDASLALVGLRGKVRLLFGMVRDNRPWRLVPSLSRALAAAAGTAAFGVFYGTIWAMADFLSPARLALISFFAIAAMVVWLINHNSLWERPRNQPARAQAVLYNTATIGTLFLGVACMYALLFVVIVLAALAVVSGPYLAKTVGHPTDFVNYLKLAWLASSLGTVAGALGSSFESEDAVRQATYSKREQERRARRRQAESREVAESEQSWCHGARGVGTPE